MPKYNIGSYHICGFDEYGSKVFTQVVNNQTQTDAIKEGNALIDQGLCHSFTILRVTYNSLVVHDKWMPILNDIHKILKKI